jgi:peptidoglycan hydrolase-like protein with peptidoglycan-binding domain
MTPEEQAQMAQAVAGLGQMFGGLAGATAGAAGPANPAGAGSAGAVPASAAPTVARSAPSLSSALMTDNLTQSAQNMLRALGYDPGNTDGELSVATTIAISQFQAEQGLEVTGEVTPQLLGILAAQVDAL